MNTANSFTGETNPKDFEASKMVAGYSTPTVGPANWPERLKKAPTVTMVFPHKVSLALDNYEAVLNFTPGVQEVPAELKDHWYLKQNLVKVYEKPEEPLPEITEKHVQFLQSQGHSVSTVAGAKKLVLGWNADLRRTFFAAADWELARHVSVPVAAPPASPAVSGADVDINKLTKAQIAEHAEEHHAVELDVNDMTRDQMIEEVERLRASA